MSLLTDREPFDICGPLPSGDHRARGERRHRQDVHDRRARGALRRRRHAARRAAAGHVHADGHRRAARARARAAGERRAGARRGARGAEPDARDEVVRLLADGAARRGRAPPPARLARALSDFDAATIATTHGFCQEVLGGLGVAGDMPRDARLRRGRRRPARARSSTTSTCAASGRRRPRRRSRAPRRSQIARDRGRPTRARRSSRRTTPSRCPRCARRLAEARARRARAAQAQLAVMTYDDLLTRLRGCCGRPAAPRSRAGCTGATAVVLVDEFQDTDPIQWEILQRAFGGGGDARADRRPEAGDLRVPRRRRLRLPRRRPRRPSRTRRCRSTGAATRA